MNTMGYFEEKIASVRLALKNELYEPALALALSLPDICGSIEYPNDSVTDRYIKWSNQYISMCKNSGAKDEFSGAALYQLRCKFLHNGHSNIYKDEGKTYTRVHFSSFELMAPSKDRLNRELMSTIKTYQDDQTGEITYTATMNLYYLIESLCEAAENFLDQWPDKAVFDDHSVQIKTYTT